MSSTRHVVRPDPTGCDLVEPLVDAAVTLVQGIRDEGLHNIAAITDDLSRQQLVALAVVLAALCPADVDPARDLEWVDLPVQEWSNRVLVREAGRWDDGARDGIALLAHKELGRRLRQTQTLVRSRRTLRSVREAS